MPLELKSFASKLSRYREQFAVSLDQLSKATGISSKELTDLESAQREPTGDQVLILADYFKCDYRFFVSNEQLAPIEQTDKLFRRCGTALSATDRWAIQEFLFLCENEAFLAGALNRHPPQTFAFVKQGNHFKTHGEDAAAKLRSFLGYPANQIPIDVFDDFRKIGVHIFRRRLANSDISGVFVRHPTAGKCVLVNYSEDVYRQRFTAAHEAAHSILDDTEDFVVSLKWEKTSLVEVRANAFAGEYLMPRIYIANLPNMEWTSDRVEEVAQRMFVNVETLLIALSRVGQIDDTAKDRLKNAKVRRGSKTDPELSQSLSKTGRAQKSGLLERGLSTHYVHLCFEAYDQGVVSAARVAEMLLSDEADLERIGRLYNWTAKHGD